ncbi:MAG: hypothetical protein KF754_10835 [Planctomycetes bacterium]|nr:hypothetical protein [Planctomycetota bacterium]
MNDCTVIHAHIPSWRTTWPAFGLATAFIVVLWIGLTIGLSEQYKASATLEQRVAMLCVAVGVLDWWIIRKVLLNGARTGNHCGRIVLGHEDLQVLGPRGAWKVAGPMVAVQARFMVLPASLSNRAPDDFSTSADAYVELTVGTESAHVLCQRFTGSKSSFARTTWEVIAERPASPRQLEIGSNEFANLIGHLSAAKGRQAGP